MPNFVFPGGYFVFVPEIDAVETWLPVKGPGGVTFELAHTTTSAIFMSWEREYQRCLAEILAHRERGGVLQFRKAESS